MQGILLWLRLINPLSENACLMKSFTCLLFVFTSLISSNVFAYPSDGFYGRECGVYMTHTAGENPSIARRMKECLETRNLRFSENIIEAFVLRKKQLDSLRIDKEILEFIPLVGGVIANSIEYNSDIPAFKIYLEQIQNESNEMNLILRKHDLSFEDFKLFNNKKEELSAGINSLISLGLILPEEVNRLNEFKGDLDDAFNRGVVRLLEKTKGSPQEVVEQVKNELPRLYAQLEASKELLLKGEKLQEELKQVLGSIKAQADAQTIEDSILATQAVTNIGLAFLRYTKNPIFYELKPKLDAVFMFASSYSKLSQLQNAGSSGISASQLMAYSNMTIAVLSLMESGQKNDSSMKMYKAIMGALQDISKQIEQLNQNVLEGFESVSGQIFSLEKRIMKQFFKVMEQGRNNYALIGQVRRELQEVRTLLEERFSVEDERERGKILYELNSIAKECREGKITKQCFKKYGEFLNTFISYNNLYFSGYPLTQNLIINRGDYQNYLIFIYDLLEEKKVFNYGQFDRSLVSLNEVVLSLFTDLFYESSLKARASGEKEFELAINEIESRLEQITKEKKRYYDFLQKESAAGSSSIFTELLRLNDNAGKAVVDKVYEYIRNFDQSRQGQNFLALEQNPGRESYWKRAFELTKGSSLAKLFEEQERMLALPDYPFASFIKDAPKGYIEVRSCAQDDKFPAYRVKREVVEELFGEELVGSTYFSDEYFNLCYHAEIVNFERTFKKKYKTNSGLAHSRSWEKTFLKVLQEPLDHPQISISSEPISVRVPQGRPIVFGKWKIKFKVKAKQLKSLTLNLAVKTTMDGRYPQIKEFSSKLPIKEFNTEKAILLRRDKNGGVDYKSLFYTFDFSHELSKVGFKPKTPRGSRALGDSLGFLIESYLADLSQGKEFQEFYAANKELIEKDFLRQSISRKTEYFSLVEKALSEYEELNVLSNLAGFISGEAQISHSLSKDMLLKSLVFDFNKNAKNLFDQCLNDWENRLYISEVNFSCEELIKSNRGEYHLEKLLEAFAL